MLDDDAPGLHADFLIDTSNSEQELLHMIAVMGSAEAKVLADAQSIERATSSMVDTKPAIAGMQAFDATVKRTRSTMEKALATPVVVNIDSAAATRELEANERATVRTANAANATEKEIEKLIRSLDRETAALGKTRDEQRAMKAEQLAITAATQGNTEAADRLLVSMRQLDAARDSLAETKLAIELAAEAGAARERAAAEAGLIAQLRERAQLEAALARIDGGDRPRATDAGATFSALAAKAAEDDARAQAIAAASAKKLADEHARLADQVRGSQLAMEADAAAAERLRMSTDPLYAATVRINAEVAESTRLYHAGATAPAEYARQQAVLADRLAQTSAAHNVMQASAKRGSYSLTQLSFQLNDVATMAMAGSPPFQIFATQIGQIIQVAQQAEGGVRGLAGEIGGFLLRFSPLIGVVAAGTAGVMLFSRAVSQGVDTKAMIDGLGLTKDEIEKLKNTSVSTGDVVKATFQVMAERVGLHLDGMSKFFGAAMDWITVKGRQSMAIVYAAIVGTFRAGAAAAQNITKGPAAVLSAMGDAYVDAFDEADGALKRFGADVTKQIAANKLADLRKQADKLKEDRPDPKVDRHAQQLERQTRAMEAQIRNLYTLADAYGVSGAAALIAEARVKAESQAIKRRADIEAAVSQQIRLAIAQRVSDAAKAAAAMRDEVELQAAINAEVANGLVPIERAGELIRQRMAELPLLAAIEAAQQRGLAAEVKKATDALDAQRDAEARLQATRKGSFYAAAEQNAARRLAVLREESRLIGANEEDRIIGMARVQAEQEILAQGYDLAEAYAKDYVAKQIEIALGIERNAQAQRSYNDQLNYTADQWDIIAGKVQSAAHGMADAFGGAGRAIGDVAAIYAGFQADRERAETDHRKRINAAGKDQVAIARETQLFALRSGGAQIAMYGDMAAAAKGFFKEGSTGYKALQAAETVYRVAQLAMSFQAMVQGAAETTAHVANAGARAAADGAAGVAAQAKLPFPANLAAMAATAAALTAIGITIAGAMGGGSKNTLPAANDGSGTVLGDSKAQSESLKRAIDQLREVDTLTNTFARQMAGSLRSIDSQIGGLAAVLVRSGNISADSKVAEGFKPDAIGSVLGAIPLVGGVLSSLFGSKTSVLASGLFGDAQSIGQILANGFDASTYSDVQKKKKFLGITTGTSYSTKYGEADAALEQQFTLVLRSFTSAIAGAAEPLGVATDAIEARLNGFVVNIGKIDLKGLTGTEIQEKLEAVFGAAADGMASAAFPGIERFQKVGEGAFETLVRVASTAEAVTNALGQMGSAARTMSIDAKLALADQFDSVGDLTSAIGSYFAAFYSPAEQAAAKTEQLTRVFGDLGITMPATLTAYRALVEAQDLNTSAGQAAYATLIQLAPAFAELQETMAGAKSAADVAAERADLERQLLELRGDTAALRALELAKLDASNRGLQEQIYAMQDAKEAAAAADELRRAWSSVGDSIMDEVRRIRGLTDAGGGNSFATLMGQFNAANAAARAGDMDAAKSLPQLSQALLGAAGDAATSRQELARVQAQTAAALEATYGIVGALSADKQGSTAEKVSAAAESRGTDSATASRDDTAAEIRGLRQENATMRQELTSALSAIAGNTGRTDKRLEAVTSASGGDALSIAVGA